MRLFITFLLLLHKLVCIQTPQTLTTIYHDMRQENFICTPDKTVGMQYASSNYCNLIKEFQK